MKDQTTLGSVKKVHCTKQAEGVYVRPFLSFTRMVDGHAIEMLIDHGLQPEVGDWTLRMSARKLRKDFFILVPPVTVLPALYISLLYLGESQAAQLVNVSSPFLLLTGIGLAYEAAYGGHGGRPDPLMLVKDLVHMASHLANLEDETFTCPPIGHKWKQYHATAEILKSTRKEIEARSWAFAKRVARAAGKESRDRQYIEWSYTARVFIRAADKPLNRMSRNEAYRVCSVHLTRLHSGRLFEPVPRNPCTGGLPPLRQPHLKARARALARIPTTYAVIATVFAASLTPVLSELLKQANH